jgi:hypothetical protein
MTWYSVSQGHQQYFYGFEFFFTDLVPNCKKENVPLQLSIFFEGHSFLESARQ